MMMYILAMRNERIRSDINRLLAICMKSNIHDG